MGIKIKISNLEPKCQDLISKCGVCFKSHGDSYPTNHSTMLDKKHLTHESADTFVHTLFLKTALRAMLEFDKN